MSDYPTLNAMGITSVDNIDHYTLRHQGETDVLKIYYKRPKGSFLARTKKFSFVRGRNIIPLEARNTKAFEDMKNISSQLMMALAELKQLDATSTPIDPVDPRQTILSDLEHLEKVITAKTEELRQKINRLN